MGLKNRLVECQHRGIALATPGTTGTSGRQTPDLALAFQDGEHRLSRAEDIAKLLALIERAETLVS